MGHSKPTGKIGPNIISVEPESSKLSWERVDFPTKKENIEKYFCERFAFQMAQAGATIYSITQNEENDFDFTLDLPGGASYLDLAEIVLQDANGNPYKKEGCSIKYSEYIDSVTKVISEKSEKYRSKSEIPISLLLYCTHWRFVPNDEIIFILQFLLLKSTYVFENVFLYTPIDRLDGTLRILCPAYPEKFISVQPEVVEKCRDKIYLNLNPNKFELLTS